MCRNCTKKDPTTRRLNNFSPPSTSSYKEDYERKRGDYVHRKEHKSKLNMTKETAKTLTTVAASILILIPRDASNVGIDKNKNKRDAIRDVRQSRNLEPIPTNVFEHMGAGFSGGVRTVPGEKTSRRRQAVLLRFCLPLLTITLQYSQ